MGCADPRGDGVHHDESAITVNVALSKPGAYGGGDLNFCGVFGHADYRKHVCSVEWSALAPGTAVVHAGLRRHAAAPVRWGRRTNLVIWGLTSRPQGILSGSWETKLAPDPECLSELYDTDFH